MIAVKKTKQFTRIRKSNEFNIYLFDLRILIITILSSTWTDVLHTNITNIVNKSFEYWHSNAWDSFIRTCSQNYIRYLNDTFLISFDFMHYRCNDLECTISHKDQMIFFDRDRRSNSTTIDKTFVRIRSVKIVDEMMRFDQFFSFSRCQISDDELLLIKNENDWIESSKIIIRNNDIYIDRNDIDHVTQNLMTRRNIKYVFNMNIKNIKFVDQLCFLRDELKILTFDKIFLFSQLLQDIESCFFVLFVNVFDLYRNMYKSLIEMYVMFAVLFHKKRQKSTNNFVLTLESHEADFKNIIIFIHTNMKIFDDDWRIKIMIFLHTNIKILDDDCQFKIKRIDKLIWAFVIVFLSDMKQQQESIDFFESRVTQCCRFCNFDTNNRENLSRDTIANEKYHFEIKKLRRDISRLFEITKIKPNLAKNDLIAKSSIFEKIISTLDIIISFSFNFAHNEYYELMKRLYSMLEKNILTSKEFEQFNDVFQNFSFSFEWDRIQFSAIHMSSWSMNECAKISIIIFVLLRCWLRSFHIRKIFETDLLREFSQNDRCNALISMNIIISYFVKLTKNNCFISFYELFEIDRLTFNEQILNVKINILKLMNAENKKFILRNKISNKSRDDDMFCDDIINVSILKTSRSFYFISKTEKNEIKNHLNSLSNYHIKIHFQKTMKKYDVLWNINVLFDENKHRFFKQTVLIINNKKSKKQFFLRTLFSSS